MKILIVDDSSFSRKITANLVLKYVYDAEVVFAEDGSSGFEKYKEVRPDYTFVDLLMPKVNGIEMIKMVKEFDGHAKIAVITADVQKSIKDEIEALGVMCFVNKPFNEEKAKILCDMIRNDKNE